MPHEGKKRRSESSYEVDDNAAVRCYTVQGALGEWLDLYKTHEVEQKLKIPNLKQGDTILPRAEFGITNDVMTTSCSVDKGCEEYKGESRYIVQVEGELRLVKEGDDEQPLIIGSQASTVVKPQNHHGLLVLPGGAHAMEEGQGDEIVLVAWSFIPGVEDPPTDGIERKGDGALPDGKPHVFVERDLKKTQVDVIVLSPDWELSWQKDVIISKPEDTKTTEIHRRQKSVMVSVPIGSVAKGDVLDVSVAAVLTSHGKKAQLASGYILLSDTQSDTAETVISVHHGFNVPSGETDTMNKLAAVTVQQDIQEAYINFAINSNGKKGDEGLIVMGDNSVEVHHYKPKSAHPDRSEL